jgi:hypothetical protein
LSKVYLFELEDINNAVYALTPSCGVLWWEWGGRLDEIEDIQKNVLISTEILQD